jgi:hypothetical protein
MQPSLARHPWSMTNLARSSYGLAKYAGELPGVTSASTYTGSAMTYFGMHLEG